MSFIRSEDGMTLVELLVVVLILGVVGGVTVQALVQGLRTNQRVEARLDAMVDLERAAQRVSRDLRRATWSDAFESGGQPTGCAVPALTAASAPTLRPDDLTVITFHSGERFRNRYRLVGGTLMHTVDRWTGSAWSAVSSQPSAAGLTNTDVFTYLGSNGEVLSASGAGGIYTTSDIRKLRKFELSLATTVNGADPVRVSTVVAARNGGTPCPTP